MPVFIEMDTAERRPGHVAGRGIPFEITLKKNNLMAAGPQRSGQRAISRGMAVAPRRRNRQAANNDLQIRPLCNRLLKRALGLPGASRSQQYTVNQFRARFVNVITQGTRVHGRTNAEGVVG